MNAIFVILFMTFLVIWLGVDTFQTVGGYVIAWSVWLSALVVVTLVLLA